MKKIPLTPKNPDNKHLKAYSKAVEEGGKLNKSMEKKLTLTFDSNKLLKNILEIDTSVHGQIKRKVEERLVDNLVSDIEDEFFGDKWNGKKEIADRVLDDLGEKQEELVKKILRKFYDSYKYKKADLTILKKLNEFLEDNE